CTENHDASVKTPCSLCLRGETGRLAAARSLSESQFFASSRLCGKQRPGMNRRTMLRTLGAALASPGLNALHAAAGRRFKYSVCNEVFEKLEFAPACKA